MRVLASIMFLLAGQQLFGAVDEKAIADQMRDDYYNLRSEGLEELSCQVQPDWDALLRAFNAGAAAEQLLPELRGVHLNVAIGADGAVTISHEPELVAPGQISDKLNVVVGGLEDMLAEFFQIWSPFALTPLIPEDDQGVAMEETADGYRFTIRSREMQLALSVSPDLRVTEGQFRGPQMDLTAKPQFTALQRRVAIDGLDVTTRAGAGMAEMKDLIELQEIEGLELPKTVTLSLGPMVVPLHFGHYEIRKRK